MRIEILNTDPDLARGIAPGLRRGAAEACFAARRRVAPGPWDPCSEREDPGGFGLLVVSGHLVRSVGEGNRVGAELLGPGDLLRPWQLLGAASSLPTEPRWTAVTGVELAVLDADFARRAAAFPAVAIELVDRTMLRSRHLALAIAIAHHPRIDERLHRLLWSYAERWGTVGPQGTALDLPLTHGQLAELAATRRPTVTTALGQLARAGTVERTDETWLLRGGPPGPPG